MHLLAIITILLTAGLCLMFIPLCRKIDLVDHPGARKVHEAATTLAGGPAFLLVFLLLYGFVGTQSLFLSAMAIGGVLMFAVGLVDDYHELSPVTRFIFQAMACLVVIALTDVQLDDFGRLFWNDVVELGWLSVPLTIFAAMGVINSFNLIDGMDGLAGCMFLVASVGMGLLAVDAPHTGMALFLLICSCAVIGYLLVNARFPWNERARVFMGDSGSLLLGFILAWCFIRLGSDHNEMSRRAFMPITAVWLFAVPLLDTATQIWRRWRAGQNPFGADQHHLHHAFLRAGFTVRQTWLAMTALAIVMAVIGVALERVGAPDYLSFWCFMVFAYSYYFYMRQTWLIQRFLGRDFIYNEFDN